MNTKHTVLAMFHQLF